jgi:hypothetical protein
MGKGRVTALLQLSQRGRDPLVFPVFQQDRRWLLSQRFGMLATRALTSTKEQ